MSNCQYCGAELIEGDLFCHACGSPVRKAGDFKQPQQEYITKAQPIYVIRKPLIARNFILWYLISMVASPLMMIYLYFNFQDLNNLDEFERPTKVPVMDINMTTILILMVLGFLGLGIFTFPYLYYLKWEKLYQYLESDPNKQKNKIDSGKKIAGIYAGYMALVILFSIGYALFSVFAPMYSFNAMIIIMVVFYLIVIGGSLGFAVYYLIQSYRWQEAYNELAYRICPETIKQDLF